MTNHYLEAEAFLNLAHEYIDAGERGLKLAALFTARAQVHATLALATRPTEQPEPELVPLSDGGPGFLDVLVSALDGNWAEVEKAVGTKCARSWKILPTVGEDPEYPDVSPRDAQALREWKALGSTA